MKTSDELIADFVGTPLPLSALKNAEQQWEFQFCEGYFPSLKTMKFKTSWDWIMPVIDKIENLGYNTEIAYLIENHGSWCAIHKTIDPTHHEIESIIEPVERTSKIEAVYEAVIKFIKWYNKNEKR